MLHYRLEGDRVIQTETDGETTGFDPKGWGSFTRGTLVVHATQIPRPFKVGADVCKDGYLVWDGGLFAISRESFVREYRSLHSPHVLGQRAA